MDVQESIEYSEKVKYSLLFYTYSEKFVINIIYNLNFENYLDNISIRYTQIFILNEFHFIYKSTFAENVQNLK